MQLEQRPSIGNFVGDDVPDDYATPVACAGCAGMTVPHPRGDVFTGPDNPWWLCDACAERSAPELIALVRRLRAIDGPVTVWQGAANIELDAFALDCPVCGTANDDHSTDWHIVDAEHGRPVCDQCVAGVDVGVRQLLADICEVTSRR